MEPIILTSQPASCLTISDSKLTHRARCLKYVQTTILFLQHYGWNGIIHPQGGLGMEIQPCVQYYGQAGITSLIPHFSKYGKKCAKRIPHEQRQNYRQYISQYKEKNIDFYCIPLYNKLIHFQIKISNKYLLGTYTEKKQKQNIYFIFTHFCFQRSQRIILHWIVCVVFEFCSTNKPTFKDLARLRFFVCFRVKIAYFQPGFAPELTIKHPSFLLSCSS